MNKSVVEFPLISLFFVSVFGYLLSMLRLAWCDNLHEKNDILYLCNIDCLVVVLSHDFSILFPFCSVDGAQNKLLHYYLL